MMIDLPLATILDMAIILLLVPTIVYAVILNRKLSALRQSKDELAKVVSSFNEATMRAEAGIPKLKKATLEANGALQERVEKAHTLRDDLAFMIERAEEMADRLEGAVRTGRAADPVQPVTPPAPAMSPASARPVPQMPTRPMTAQPEPSVATRTLAGAALASGEDDDELDLRAAIGAARAEAKVTGQREPGPAFGRQRPVAESIGSDEERSEAERELLKALQSAR